MRCGTYNEKYRPSFHQISAEAFVDDPSRSCIGIQYYAKNNETKNLRVHVQSSKNIIEQDDLSVRVYGPRKGDAGL